MPDWIVTDTSVLVELTRGGPKSDAVKAASDGRNWIVPEIVLAEFSAKLHEYGVKDVASVLESLARKSVVQGVNVLIADRAGQLRARHRDDGLATNDAVIWATAEHYGAKLLTLDHDFKPFKDAIVL